MRLREYSTGWWYHASNDQKIAQIDGALSVGMNARVLAFNLGMQPGLTSQQAVYRFARLHGRKFPRGNFSASGLERMVAAVKKKNAQNVDIDGAFEIFGVRSS
jgi:hypothetical protein